MKDRRSRACKPRRDGHIPNHVSGERPIRSSPDGRDHPVVFVQIFQHWHQVSPVVTASGARLHVGCEKQRNSIASLLVGKRSKAWRFGDEGESARGFDTELRPW
jgi:hypothetical protein